MRGGGGSGLRRLKEHGVSENKWRSIPKVSPPSGQLGNQNGTLHFYFLINFGSDSFICLVLLLIP
jgi:hypothetical protein